MTGTTTLNDLDFDADSTVNRNNTTQTGTTTYDENYNATYEGGVITYENTEINYDSQYTLIGCTGAQTTPHAEPLDVDATKVEVTVVYDNTALVPGDAWTKLVVITESSGDVIADDAGNAHSGEVTIAWAAGNVTATQTNGDGTSTVDICQYSGGVIINDNGSITNNDNTITNNNGTTTNNVDTTENYTGDSVVNYYDTVINENNVTHNYISVYELIGTCS